MGKAWNQQGISNTKIKHCLLSFVKQVLYMHAYKVQHQTNCTKILPTKHKYD